MNPRKLLGFPTTRFHASAACQVKVGEEVPALITPTKPKYYLLGKVELGAGRAVKLA